MIGQSYHKQVFFTFEETENVINRKQLEPFQQPPPSATAEEKLKLRYKNLTQ